MKTNVLTTTGKGKEIELPENFESAIREDIVKKFLVAKNLEKMQQYTNTPFAGMKYSASGIVKHARHKWKTSYGRGQARVPRKIMWRRGTQFFWIGATVSGTRGGRQAHPPKIKNLFRKINKKEAKMAFNSALAATANKEKMLKKYSTIEDIKINLPVVIDSKMLELKTKQFYQELGKILGNLHEIAIQKKQIRAGKGKMRNRKYKKTAGLLLVIGNNEKKKIQGYDVRNVKNLSVMDLAKGGLGRLVVYTEEAINDLKNKETKK